MKLKTLHQDSYNQLTDYYADLSAPMAALRRHILDVVLCATKPESSLHLMGNFAACEELLPAIDLQASILDVGCANGDNLNIMQQMGFKHLSGIDVSPEMVACAKSKTQLPIHCVDLFEYEGNSADIVFAQALVHLFPKQELPKVLKHLLSKSRKALYFSTTIHKQAIEGLEPKFQVVRYRSRYTQHELLTKIRDVMSAVNDEHNTWRVCYFFLTDCLGKYWINVVFDKVELTKCYERDGIILHRHLFNENTIEALHNELDYLATHAAPKNTWLRYDDDNVFDRVENFLQYLTPALQEQFSAPSLKILLEKCFANKVTLLKDKCNFKPPGKSDFPLHQDAAAGWEKRGYGNKHITLAISLDNATLENGALQFAIGKHRAGLYAPLYQTMSTMYLTQWDFQTIHMAPGDALIFDSYLPHFSTENRTQQTRKLIFLTFVDERYADVTKHFFTEKRLRQPPIDERSSATDLVRDQYGKWIYKQ